MLWQMAKILMRHNSNGRPPLNDAKSQDPR
jgi:hypothetical protein